MTVAAPSQHGDPRPARKQARFQEILAVAWDVANEHGLAALSMGEVARRVGIRQPSLYTYVDSKMGLYDAMFGQAARALMDKVMAVSYSDDPRQAVRQIAEVLFEYRPANPAGGPLLGAWRTPNPATNRAVTGGPGTWIRCWACSSDTPTTRRPPAPEANAW